MKFFNNFRTAPKFPLLYNTSKTEQKLFLEKNFFVPEKKIRSDPKFFEIFDF